MSTTEISWTDKVWNPVVGCSRVSPGCERCYAERMAFRLATMPQAAKRYAGLTKKTTGGKIQWTGAVRAVPEVIDAPLRWKKPTKVFVNSMSDLFHEDVPFETVAAVFGVMAACPQHTFQVLTKRPERAVAFFEWFEQWTASKEGFGHVAEGQRLGYALKHFAERALETDRIAIPWGGNVWPLANVHLGVSCENQPAADQRIAQILKCPAAVRFVSAEPLLGGINFHAKHLGQGSDCAECGFDVRVDEDGCCASCGEDAMWYGIDWVIVGGESGPGARPCDLAWIRSIVAQCKAADVACFVKQLGVGQSLHTDIGRGRHVRDSRTGEEFIIRDRKGGDMAEWPSDVRVREFPVTTGGAP